MKANSITLMVARGDLPKERYTFEGPARAVIGRAPDCAIRVPQDLAHMSISRHHCLLDIDPPQVRVRDLGSRNGTYLNGEKIGQREQLQVPETPEAGEAPEREVRDGDEIQVGQTVFRVAIDENEPPPVPIYFL